MAVMDEKTGNCQVPDKSIRTLLSAAASRKQNQARLFAACESLEVGDWLIELRNDELADITFRDVMVLRAIRAVVRDSEWRTLRPTVRSAVQRVGTDGTELQLEIEFDGYGCFYAGALTVHFGVSSLQVTFDGVASGEFQSNRIGLVVLHRPDEAGQAVTVTGHDGIRRLSHFPFEISPHQPFFDVASMCWERDGVPFRLDFTGDVFETEDQRNWTDASFKTYSTPLARPFPVQVRVGSSVHQSLTLTASDPLPINSARAAQATKESVRVIDHVDSVVPALSVSASIASDEPLRRGLLAGLDALVFEIVAGITGGEEAGRAKEQAAALGVSLDVRLVVDSPEQVSELLSLLPPENVVRLAVFHSTSHVTERALWEALRYEANKLGFTSSLVAGTRAHFTELNRMSPWLPHDATAFAYSITPQMHATEVPHIVESLPIQRLTALNALRIASGQPLHIGPITLKPRFNAVSSSRAVPMAEPADPLQSDPFSAAWLLGSIAALSLPGVESISYFELAGPGGIIGPQGLTAAGQLLSALASLHGKPVLQTEGTPSGLVLYPVRDNTRLILFAANLTRHRLETTVDLHVGRKVDLRLEPWTMTVHETMTGRRNP